MTTPISNEEIHDIVQRIVGKTMENQPQTSTITSPTQEPEMPNGVKKTRVVAIGTDHGGLDLKETLKKYLIENGYEVIDVGTNTKESVDYPDIAFSVAQLVAEGKAWRGVIIDGAGIGSCMAA
ncbi:MAG: RpiB/LacA/LacB family sugar-phosphate isomerase, partial [Chloroflexota bacterium]|nr:RpiB/LacA/LacB family sugar-phosphate isomerase [Chloroflexota bacterium]